MSGTWRTGTGETILISKMETSHLIVINIEHKYNEMKLELEKRGVNKNE